MRIDSLRHRALRLHVVVCALLIRASLRTRSLRVAVRTARTAGALCRSRASVGQCVAIGSATADRLAHRTCLYRALTVYALLVRRQPAVQFHVGAARAGEFATHAWVTVDGFSLDADALRYSTLWSTSSEA
jgi:Transglutaminase-like superfamily